MSGGSSSSSGGDDSQLQSAVEAILDLEEIDVNLFRGFSPEKPRWGRIYGGQTVSQVP